MARLPQIPLRMSIQFRCFCDVAWTSCFIDRKKVAHIRAQSAAMCCIKHLTIHFNVSRPCVNCIETLLSLIIWLVRRIWSGKRMSAAPTQPSSISGVVFSYSCSCLPTHEGQDVHLADPRSRLWHRLCHVLDAFPSHPPQAEATGSLAQQPLLWRKRAIGRGMHPSVTTADKMNSCSERHISRAGGAWVVAGADHSRHVQIWQHTQQTSAGAFPGATRRRPAGTHKAAKPDIRPCLSFFFPYDVRCWPDPPVEPRDSAVMDGYEPKY